MIGTKDPGKDNFMKIAAFGQMTIEVSPSAGNIEILNVDIACEHRKDVMSMKTNKDETIDQFCGRVRSMLRALSNAEPRVLPAEVVTKEDNKKPPKTWDEQKKAMKPAEAKA